MVGSFQSDYPLDDRRTLMRLVSWGYAEAGALCSLPALPVVRLVPCGAGGALCMLAFPQAALRITGLFWRVFRSFVLPFLVAVLAVWWIV